MHTDHGTLAPTTSIAARAGIGPHVALRNAAGALIVAEVMDTTSQGLLQLRIIDGLWGALLDDEGTLQGIRPTTPQQHAQTVTLAWVGRLDRYAFDSVDTMNAWVEDTIAKDARAGCVPVPIDMLGLVMHALTASGYAPLARDLAALQDAHNSRGA